MARVLLAGGFAEEALPLLAKSLGRMAHALSANRGEAAAASGPYGDIRNDLLMTDYARVAIVVTLAFHRSALHKWRAPCSQGIWAVL